MSVNPILAAVAVHAGRRFLIQRNNWIVMKLVASDWRNNRHGDDHHYANPSAPA